MMSSALKILTVGDKETNLIKTSGIKQRFGDVDFVISCGDLSYYYLEYIVSMLDIPLYFVRGNHARKVEYSMEGNRTRPWGADDLHRRCIRSSSGVLLAGIEGSIRYSDSPFQYTQGEMWQMVFELIPKFLINRVRYGRYLDIFVSHAPMWGVHDKDDLPHTGIKAFRWLVTVFQPLLHLHGHIHVYHPDEVIESLVKCTRVVNAYGYRILTVDAHQRTSRLLS